MNNYGYYVSGKQKALFAFIVIFIIGLLGTGIYYFNKTIGVYMANIDQTPLMRTYAQNEVYEYQKREHRGKATIQDIAYTQMEQATGLSGNVNHFTQWGVHTGDKFVRYGILSGDGVPYSSNMKNSYSGGSLTRFDIQDQKYWKNIKDKDFKGIKNKVNDDLPKLSSKHEQENQIKDAIKKAQQDDIMNAGQRREKHDKKLTPTDVQ